MNKVIGFAPIYDNNSRVLIMGSFPSVKSREIDFYYGNKQNRFWKTICDFFHEDIPQTIDEKKDFLRRNHIALWDVVVACEIEGSADSSIKNAEIADIYTVIDYAPIECILFNGSLAYELFCKQYPNFSVPCIKMPSTSPANPRFNQSVWVERLYDVFKIHQ